MDMSPVHMCVFLSHKHEELKRKIGDLRNYIAFLVRTVGERSLDHKRSCSMSCQTDIVIQYRPRPIEPKRPTFDEEAHLHRLINARNELLRKYEH